MLERSGVQIKDESDFEDLFNMYDSSGNGKISFDEFAQRYRLDRDSFYDFLQIRANQNEKCGSLPVTVLFFIVYVLLIMLHEDTTVVFGLDHGVKNYFTNIAQTKTSLTLNDLETVDDAWTWLDEALVPSLAEEGAAVDDLRVSRYTVVIGSAITLEQTRATTKMDDIFNWCSDVYGHPCHASYELSSDAFGWPLCDASNITNCVVTSKTRFKLPSDLVTKAQSQQSKDLAYVQQTDFDRSEEAFKSCTKGGKKKSFCFQLVTSAGIEDLRAELQTLRQRRWIDLYTKTVRISMYLYNGDLGVYTSVAILMNFNIGGELEAKYNSKSIVSDPYGGIKRVLFGLDAIWIAMVLWLGLTEAKEMYEATQESNKKSCCARYLTYWEDKWNYVDWTQIVLALTVQIMWFTMYTDILMNVTTKLRDLNKPNMTTVDDSPASYQQIYDQLDTTLEQASAYRTIATINLFVLLIRFFKAFGGQPKLAKISSTIALAAVDIIHHGIIMSILFLSFMFAGMFLFGHHVKEWGTLESALTTTLMIWFSAEMEWEHMFNTNPTMSVVWYCTFILLMVFIVLNLFLAIIIGGYSDAKARLATGETTLWKQVFNFIKQAAAQRKGSISLEYVMELVRTKKHVDDEVDTNQIQLKEESVSILDILSVWIQSQEQGGEEVKEQAKLVSIDFLQQLVSDYMYYKKQQNKMEEDIHKQIMYNRIRDMDYHFQTLKQMSQRISLRLDRAARALDDENKTSSPVSAVSPMASRSDRDLD